MSWVCVAVILCTAIECPAPIVAEPILIDRVGLRLSSTVVPPSITTSVLVCQWTDYKQTLRGGHIVLASNRRATVAKSLKIRICHDWPALSRGMLRLASRPPLPSREWVNHQRSRIPPIFSDFIDTIERVLKRIPIAPRDPAPKTSWSSSRLRKKRCGSLTLLRSNAWQAADRVMP